MSGKVVVFEKDLLKSLAYHSLTKTEIIVLNNFMMKRRIKIRRLPNGSKHTDIINNGEIEYCFSEALKQGIPKNTFNNCLHKLVEVGFLDIAHQGSGGRKGDKNLYAMSERWRLWGSIKFEKKEKRKDPRKGIGFSLMHNNKK